MGILRKSVGKDFIIKKKLIANMIGMGAFKIKKWKLFNNLRHLYA